MLTEDLSQLSLYLYQCVSLVRITLLEGKRAAWQPTCGLWTDHQLDLRCREVSIDFKLKFLFVDEQLPLIKTSCTSDTDYSSQTSKDHVDAHCPLVSSTLDLPRDLPRLQRMRQQGCAARSVQR